MLQIEAREFTNVHVSWIMLFDKLESEGIINRYKILKAYPETNMMDVVCYITEKHFKEFDDMCCYDGGNGI
jgi:hypothetical protein